MVTTTNAIISISSMPAGSMIAMVRSVEQLSVRDPLVSLLVEVGTIILNYYYNYRYYRYWFLYSTLAIRAKIWTASAMPK